MQLPDGSDDVHVLTSSGGEYHVHVSKDFKLAGTEQRSVTPPTARSNT